MSNNFQLCSTHFSRGGEGGFAPLVTGLISSKEFTFDVLEIADKSWFLIFCTHNKQWWIAK